MTEHPSIIDAAEERRLYEASLAGRDEPIRVERDGRDLLDDVCPDCGGLWQCAVVEASWRPTCCVRCGRDYPSGRTFTPASACYDRASEPQRAVGEPLL